MSFEVFNVVEREWKGGTFAEATVVLGIEAEWRQLLHQAAAVGH
jgi:hypothetical protein